MVCMMVGRHHYIRFRKIRQARLLLLREVDELMYPFYVSTCLSFPPVPDACFLRMCIFLLFIAAARHSFEPLKHLRAKSGWWW